MIRTESWVKNRDTNRIVGLVYRYSPSKNTLNMNPACSASLLMNDTDVRFHLLHTYILKRVMLAVTSASAVSLNEDINT